MLAEMMRLMGFQVFISPGGLRAVDLIDEKRPAVVLLDQMMPEISGLQILQLLHANPRLSMIPVIMVSAKVLPADVRHGLDAGASFYLAKPVAFVDLRRTVEQIASLTEQRTGSLSSE